VHRDYPSRGYFAYAAHPGASARRGTRRATRHAARRRPGASARRTARRRPLRLRRASGCLCSPRGLSSTTSPTSRVRVPRHVTRLVVDYFAYAARPGASARRAARRRLLRLHRASGCLNTSRGSSCRSSSTTSPTPRVRVPRHVARHIARLVVDYFDYARVRVLRHVARSSSTTSTTSRVRVPRHVARLVTRLVAPLVVYFDYAARPGASARRATRHAARRAAHRRLLCLHGASECLGTSRGLSSTTSPTPRVRVPRHVTRLVVDYFVRRDFVLRPHWLYFSHAVRCDYLSRVCRVLPRRRLLVASR
jgi:hypothetical protein